MSIDVDLFSDRDDNSSDDFNLALLRGRLEFDTCIDCAVLVEQKRKRNYINRINNLNLRSIDVFARFFR